MSRVRSQSVNDIYDPTRFARDSGIHDDIYTSDGEDFDPQRESESEYSFDSQRSLPSEYSFDSQRSLPSDSVMPPPPSKSKAEMELRKLTKEELIKKYLELDATEKGLREYGSKIIRHNRELKEDNDVLLKDMEKQNAKIEILKMAQERLEREKKELQSTYQLLKARVSDLTGRKSYQGGKRTRRK
jgi:hypothetical protein